MPTKEEKINDIENDWVHKRTVRLQKLLENKGTKKQPFEYKNI